MRLKPGWEWPFSIIAFFLLLTVINVWVTYTSFTAPGSLLEAGAYEKGLRYEETIDQVAVPVRAGWQVDFLTDNNLIKLDLRDANGSPLIVKNVQVRAIRPADASVDFTLDLPEVSPGKHAAAVVFPQPGLWLFEVSFDAGGRQALLKLQRHVSVKPVV